MKQRFSYVVNLFLSFLTGILLTYIYNEKVLSSENVEVVHKDITITESNTIGQSIEKIYDSVVVVEVETRTGSGTGSGFVYKKDDLYGYIITNHHVVDDAK